MFYRYLLIVRFALVNLVAIALTVAAFLQGWLDGLFIANLRELSSIIFLVFFYGLVLCGARIWRHSIDLNDLNGGTPEPDSRIANVLDQTSGADSHSRSIQMDSFRLKLTDRIVRVRHIANSLVFLGLIGTVIGFIIALSGVDPAAATESENVATMISTLITGMSVALHTTLIGSVLYVWLIVNYWILTSGTVDLITAITEQVESRARA